MRSTSRPLSKTQLELLPLGASVPDHELHADDECQRQQRKYSKSHQEFDLAQTHRTASACGWVQVSTVVLSDNWASGRLSSPERASRRELRCRYADARRITPRAA